MVGTIPYTRHGASCSCSSCCGSNLDGFANLADFLPEDDGVDVTSHVQAAFVSGRLENKHVYIPGGRRYLFLTKPTEGLGPQGQYFTPPKTCALEWLPGAKWDFSAYGQSGNDVYVRRQGRYGTAYEVVGSLTKGASSIPLEAGAGAALTELGITFGSWLTLHNTERQDDLVGAFTLADAFGTGFAARANNLWVKEIIGDTLYLLNSLDDDYDATAVPVVKAVLEAPDIRLINPNIVGPGVGGGGNDDRFFQIALGRCRIEGGSISNFAQSVRIFSCPNGYVRDLTLYGIKQIQPGGGLTLGDATEDFLVENCTAYGGCQMFMQSGSGAWWGVTRHVTFRNCKAYFPFNGFITHNIAEKLFFENCKVYFSRSYSYDWRCPDITSSDCLARGSDREAFILRIAPGGLNVDNFLAEDCRSGGGIQDDYDPPYEPLSVGDLSVVNSAFLRIGAAGSSNGALFFRYNGGGFPVLGTPTLESNRATMLTNATAMRVQGKWTGARVTDNDIRGADGFTPSGVAYLIDAPDQNPSTSDGGPSDVVFARNLQGGSFRDPVVKRVTGLTTYSANTILGQTGTGVRNLTTDTVLRLVQTDTTFTNKDAPGTVNVEMPLSDARNFAAKFDVYVRTAQTFNWRSVGLNKIQIGSATPGLNIRSNVVGAHIGLTALDFDLWQAETTSPSDWTQDWSPFSLLTDMTCWFDQAPAYISETEDVDAGVDVVTRWVDMTGTGLIFRPVSNALAPVLRDEWMDFASGKYLAPTSIIGGVFPSGANAGSTWVICKQTAAASDTSTRTVLAWGDTANTSRALVRVVDSGVNRFAIQIGTGASVTTVMEGTVDFTGWHWVRLKYDGTDATAIIDGTASTPVTVAASTTVTRIRSGADALTAAGSFWNGKKNDIIGTVAVPTDEADLEAWLDARVAMLNLLDP